MNSTNGLGEGNSGCSCQECHWHTGLPAPWYVAASSALAIIGPFDVVQVVRVARVVRVVRQACSPLIQLFFGFASDIDQTNINRDIRDGNWLSMSAGQQISLTSAAALLVWPHSNQQSVH